MPIYSYKAISSTGKMVSGRIEVESEAKLRLNLKRSGQQLLQVKEIPGIQQGAINGLTGGRKPPMGEVASTIRQLSILIKAGVPLVEAIGGLADLAKSEVLGACLKEIGTDVSHGMALSAAFARHPNALPVLAVEMAKVAEAGGDLAQAMERLADHIESGAEIVQRVKSAMAYPMVVMVISFVTVIVMSTFILPRFVTLFSQMGAELPWTTKALMSMSHIMTSYWYLILVGCVLLVYALRKYFSSPIGRKVFDRAAMKLPLIGDIVKKIVLNRVIASMSTLLSSGVPMVQTLEISAAAANNAVVKEALLRAGTDVAEGNALSQSLRASGVFPPLVLQMVTSGEKTGELPAMLGHICLMYERETDAKIKSLTTVIEPIMIAVLGVIVGFIAISVIVPIYSLVGGVR